MSRRACDVGGALQSSLFELRPDKSLEVGGNDRGQNRGKMDDRCARMGDEEGSRTRDDHFARWIDKNKTSY